MLRRSLAPSTSSGAVTRSSCPLVIPVVPDHQRARAGALTLPRVFEAILDQPRLMQAAKRRISFATVRLLPGVSGIACAGHDWLSRTAARSWITRPRVSAAEGRTCRLDAEPKTRILKLRHPTLGV